MIIPTIYCDKKQALPNEDITIVASIRVGEWQFPNIGMSNIAIQSGTLESNVLTFKCLIPLDPLIIDFVAIVDEIKNGQQWTDEILPNLGDYWQTPLEQANSILLGWNFDGRSQRVTQTTSEEVPYIYQPNLTLSGNEYTVELDYRTVSETLLKIGGQTYELSATEVREFPIYPIVHGTGTFDCIALDGGTVKWILTDGSVAYTNRVTKYLTGGTSYLILDNFVGSSISSIGTGNIYMGSLSDIPSGISVLELENANIWGNLAKINHITDTVYISNDYYVYGDISNLSNVASVIDLNGCEYVEGDISALINTETINLNGTSVYGRVTVDANFTDIRLNNTNLTKWQLEQSLINTSTRATSLSILDGHFEALTNMPTVGSTETCNAIYNLRDKGWTVLVNNTCTYG